MVINVMVINPYRSKVSILFLLMFKSKRKLRMIYLIYMVPCNVIIIYNIYIIIIIII
jgi:hypothetical protein